MLIGVMKRVGLAWDVVTITPERQAQKLIGAEKPAPKKKEEQRRRSPSRSPSIADRIVFSVIGLPTTIASSAPPAPAGARRARRRHRAAPSARARPPRPSCTSMHALRLEVLRDPSPGSSAKPSACCRSPPTTCSNSCSAPRAMPSIRGPLEPIISGIFRAGFGSSTTSSAVWYCPRRHPLAGQQRRG